MKDNVKIVTAAVQQNGLALEHASANGLALEHATEEMKDKIVTAAVQQNGLALELASAVTGFPLAYGTRSTLSHEGLALEHAPVTTSKIVYCEICHIRIY